MPIIAVTRLRLRDPALLDEFLTATVAVLEQAKIHVAISARTSSPTRTTHGGLLLPGENGIRFRPLWALNRI
jgi:hypothetical protein